LNEVCITQYEWLRPYLYDSGYHPKFKEQRGGLSLGEDLRDEPGCGTKFGVVAAAYAWDGLQSDADWYVNQEVRRFSNDERWDKGERVYVCVPGNRNRSYAICSTHLTSLGDSRNIRAAQLGEYWNKVHNNWAGRARFAAGDLNQEPADSMFTQWYQYYWEADVNRLFGTVAQKSTKCSGSQLKIDYIWAIKVHTVTSGYAAKSCSTPSSDHTYYRGFFAWD
jgi:hypothetical protein